MRYIIKKLITGRILAVSLLLMIISGCLFAPKHKVTTFDLGTPKSIGPQNIRLSVMPFMNNTEAGYQMLYKIGKNQVESDAYNRWIETPGLLITSYLSDAFSSSSNKETFTTDDDYTLYGEVTLFEINLKEKCTVLCVNYRIKHNNRYISEKDVTLKQTFDIPSPNILVALHFGDLS